MICIYRRFLYLLIVLASTVSTLALAPHALARPNAKVERVKSSDLQCVAIGDQLMIQDVSRTPVWGKVRRSERNLRIELRRLNAQLVNARGAAARTLRIKRRDLELMAVELQNCITDTNPAPSSTPTATPQVTDSPTPTPSNEPPPVAPTPTPVPSKVPVFIAQGHAGRLIMSCDDGQTWINNTDQTVSPAVRCWNNVNITVGSDVEVRGCTNNTCDDCDHQNWAGRGLAYGDGAFVAAWGWGKPGKVQRSLDGINWTTVVDSVTNADVSFGNGVFMTGRARPLRSEDNGITWNQVTLPQGYDEYFNVRSIGFGGWPLGGHFFIFGDGDRLHRIPLSGATVTTPAHDSGCGTNLVGSATNNSVIVSTHATYNPSAVYTCRSGDGGQTWIRRTIANATVPSLVLWTGSEFVFWSDLLMYRSTDGITWSTQPLVANNFSQFPQFGAVARSDSGTYAMINGDWARWYEQQRFFRSTDGIHWTQLAAGSFVGSHLINFMEFGYVDPVAGGCPAR